MAIVDIEKAVYPSRMKSPTVSVSSERRLSYEDEVANWLLAESADRGELLTNLKLQKLLFYSQAWALVELKHELFKEDFQAWVHGPVLPSQYARFSNFAWRPITGVSTGVFGVERPVVKPDVDSSVAMHLEEVLNVFGTESAIALEAMTHAELPWIEARGALSPTQPSNAIISKASMRKFYSEMP